MFEQASLAIEDHKHFDEVKAALEQLFTASNVAGYLRLLKKSKLRVRDFEGILARGLMGRALSESYAVLGHSDQGQVRELYLSLIERVSPELRVKFLRLYSYY